MNFNLNQTLAGLAILMLTGGVPVASAGALAGIDGGSGEFHADYEASLIRHRVRTGDTNIHGTIYVAATSAELVPDRRQLSQSGVSAGNIEIAHRDRTVRAVHVLVEDPGKPMHLRRAPGERLELSTGNVVRERDQTLPHSSELRPSRRLEAGNVRDRGGLRLREIEVINRLGDVELGP